MKGLSIKLVILSLVTVCCQSLWAQNVSNVTAQQVDKSIHVSYDLDKQAEISLHLSIDGGKTYTELHQLSGDVGKNVAEGHKTIVWDVLAEREKLASDNVIFKVKAQREDYLVFTVKGVSFEMVYVKGGTYIMGCTSEQGKDCSNDENPLHPVKLSDFYIGNTEVTQALWEKVMGNNPSFFKGDNLPVESINWNDCQEFVKRLNLLTGKSFRLPTEAQWEYAARGGSKSQYYKYSGSNYISEVAWYSYNSSLTTHPVGTKKANELGLYDMSGNVWEWCSDWYGKYGSYLNFSQANPKGPSSGSYHVDRGGSWHSDVANCRISNRDFSTHNYRSSYLGLRLVLDCE